MDSAAPNIPSAEAIVAGVDFGSDSVRVLVLDAISGRVKAQASRSYRRWAERQYCDPLVSRFRQHPEDHLEALIDCFQEVTQQLDGDSIQAIAIDTTGSTPAPTNAEGVPLALLPEFAESPDCMFWLWKDRTATAEAEEVNRVLGSFEPDYTRYQGTYSSEWWWAKILKAIRDNPSLRENAHSWVEHADWLANMLVGQNRVEDFRRNACAAGHKALYNRELGGKVPDAILDRLDPYLTQVQATCAEPSPAGTDVGHLNAEWALKLGLSTQTRVAVGSLDAHAGAVGAGIRPGRLVKVMGTSTVDMFLTDYAAIRGYDTSELCGIAEDSIIPGTLGGEAGQAAFGDLFAWYSRLVGWSMQHVLSAAEEPGARNSVVEACAVAERATLRYLDEAAATRPPSKIVALDWINGRRYPFPDESATAALLGLRIGHDAVDIYKALVESAALGTKYIYEELKKAGIGFGEVVLVGGIAAKSPYVCQQIANALDTPLMVSSETEVCAKGAAMYATVAAKIYNSLEAAQYRLCEEFRVDFAPQDSEVKRLASKYEEYRLAGARIAMEA